MFKNYWIGHAHFATIKVQECCHQMVDVKFWRSLRTDMGELRLSPPSCLNIMYD